MSATDLTCVLMALLRFEMTAERPDEAILASFTERLNEVYTLAAEHDVAHLVAHAALTLIPEQLTAAQRAAMDKVRLLAVYRSEQKRYQIGEVRRVFREAQIPFVLLKGAVMRERYPEAWMRTSCDIDVLVPTADAERACEVLVRELSYEKEGLGSHDVSLRAPDGVHVELHIDLCEPDYRPFPTLSPERVFAVAQVAPDGWERTLPDELLYVYHIAHMAKHVWYGGCGIRPFLDELLLLDESESVAAARHRALEAEGLVTFDEVVRELCRAWLLGGPMTERAARLEGFLLRGGVYGTRENRVAVQQSQRGGRLGYLLSRLFLPFAVMRRQYPVLKRWPVLLPVCHVRRWCRLIFGGRLAHGVRELSYNASMDAETGARAAELLHSIGL